ncbi:hypothetical protein COU60_02760, partial [Candidatus Pacearchaeota archaeon CG10_big_fil_rev_8_21_14_0_10_34_76]
MSGINLNELQSAVFSAKKELKNYEFQRALQYLFLTLSLITALLFIFSFFMDFFDMTGYATYIEAGGGSVTGIDITQKFPAEQWAGIYGFALRVPGIEEQFYSDVESGTISRSDVFFSCINPEAVGGPELFSSTSPSLDFSDVEPADVSAVDSLINCTGYIYCANNTFTENMTIYIGDTIVENIPSTYTYKYDGSNEIFDIGIVNVSGKLAFVSHITSDFQKGYNPNVTVNYQMLLPTPESSTTRHYFFADPNDECPGGGIGSSFNATAYGYIFDNSGNAIENATINVAGYSTDSNVSGDYNLSFLVMSGTYNLVVQKSGFFPGFAEIDVNFTNSVIEQNITLYPEVSDNVINPIVNGTVRDSAGSAISSAIIVLGDNSTTSDSSGSYSFTPSVIVGEQPIISFKQGYDNYYYLLNFSQNTSAVEHNIVMLEADNFATGPYTDEYQQAKQEAEEAGIDYWISTQNIKKEVRVNTFIEEEIKLFNFKSSDVTLSFSLASELEELIKMNKKSVVIPPDESGSVVLSIFGNVPIGVYSGNLSVTGDIEQEIPIYVEVIESGNIIDSLLLSIDLFKNSFRPGEDLKSRITLDNFLDKQSYQVLLNYYIVDVNNSRVFYSESEEVEIENSLTLLKNFPIPEEDMEDGNYLLKVEAKHLNLISTGIASFIIAKPLYLYAFLGIPLWTILVGVSAFSFLMFNFFLYRAHVQKKKRYKLELNTALLPKSGPRSITLGKIAERKDLSYYNIDMLTTHAIVAGATGGGKSISAQVIVEEALKKDIAVIVFDPTAQWSGMLRKCEDKKMLSFYPKFGLKPSDAKAFPGNVKMIKDPRQAIDIKKYMNPGHIQILALNKLDPSDMDKFVSSVIVSIFRSSPEEHPGLRFLLVFDEVHRLLPKFGGSGEGFLQIERACREFRKWGFGVMLVSQVLSDFVGEIKANINTEVQMRVSEEKDLARIKERYGLEALKSLVKADVGVGMVQNAEYNRGLPYFVAFRPILHSTRRLPDDVLDKYNEYGEKIEDLEYQIEQLETEKVDTFDLKMELKLVKD